MSLTLHAMSSKKRVAEVKHQLGGPGITLPARSAPQLQLNALSLLEGCAQHQQTSCCYNLQEAKHMQASGHSRIFTEMGNRGTNTQCVPRCRAHRAVLAQHNCRGLPAPRFFNAGTGSWAAHLLCHDLALLVEPKPQQQCSLGRKLLQLSQGRSMATQHARPWRLTGGGGKLFIIRNR